MSIGTRHPRGGFGGPDLARPLLGGCHHGTGFSRVGDPLPRLPARWPTVHWATTAAG